MGILIPKRQLAWLILALLAGCQARAEPAWRQFVSSEGRFQVSMPGVPTIKKGLLKTSAGTAEEHLFSVFFGDYPSCAMRICFYIVSYANIPSGLDPVKLLTERLSQHVTAFRGTVTKESRINLRGVRGQEIELAVEGGAVIRSRLYVTNSRIYELFAGGDQRAVYAESDGQMFFNSFSLDE